MPDEAGGMQLFVSTQHPGEVQHMVAHALGIDSHAVVVSCRRMGGGFGGKETQMSLIACVAAVLARRSGRAVKLRLDRDDDMRSTGKRHAFAYRYDVGYDDEGRILGLDLTLASRCGFSADLSGPVNDRAVFHADNAYWLPDVAIHSYRCRTNTVSDTAFRGFGGPQGMFAIEQVIDEIARSLGRDPLDVRKANFYGVDERNVTPFGMTVEDNIAPPLVERLERTSRYRERREALAALESRKPGDQARHRAHAGQVRHLVHRHALQPGRRARARVSRRHGAAEPWWHGDGPGPVHEGATGRGARAGHSARARARVRVRHEQDPECFADGGIVRQRPQRHGGARRLSQASRAIDAIAARELHCEPAEVEFRDGIVRGGGRQLPFAEVTRAAYFARVPLFASGFYATPKIHYDRKTLSGRPFFYYAYGAAVSEVAIDTLTGEHRLVAVDILHDVGTSLNPAIDRGQIEGGFLQGWGWLAMEELWWNERGELRTHAPSTYKIPTSRDWPDDVRIELWTEPNREDTIYRSKAVGEPPFMLALSGFHAIRDAIASVAAYRLSPRLDAPATDERILASVDEIRTRMEIIQ